MSSIITIQFNKFQNSRTYSYFDSRGLTIEYILSLFEEYDKTVKISEIRVLGCNELFNFLYSLYDFAYYEKERNVFIPYGKDCFCKMILEYIKENIEGK
jgi:hypothetical protein